MDSNSTLEEENMFKHFFPVFIMLLLGFQQAAAHDAWLQQKDGGLILGYGHGGKLEAYDPEKVKDGKAVDCKGATVPMTIEKQNDGVAMAAKGAPATVTALFDGGYGVKTTEGYKKMTKREAQGKFSMVEASKSRKYAKAMLTPCDGFAKPVGLVFEIVPEEDPFAAKPGQALPVKVLLDGKPVEGAVIKTGDAGHSEQKDVVKTDKDGKASATITKPGFQLIVASFKTPLTDDPDADVLSLSTALTFEVH
jgi:nickel transport protein